MTCTLFEHYSQFFLLIEISNAIENQQQQDLTLSEEALLMEVYSQTAA